ncbi:MAG: adenylosuccinate lyase [Bacteroidales bacterium]|nr:adenylosuccinate lyase [Bacteroidales bacterium]
MNLSSLTAISPIDGRYAEKTLPLREYFSEYAFIKYRTKTEVEYFIALCEIPLPQLANFPIDKFEALRKLYEDFTIEDTQKVKDIERVTNHDVKAVEYFLRDKFDELNLSQYKEFIHFGLTSQDINNTAMPMMLHDAHENVVIPQLNTLCNKLLAMSQEWINIPMLAHTHGQPASPTTLGKEIYVFYERLSDQLDTLNETEFYGKFGGATGNFNAHKVAFPLVDWRKFGDMFLKCYLGLKRYTTTTQIEHYDMFAAYCQNMMRINTILLDLDRDVWTYISMNYFKQTIKKDEVGSSAMPHKVNPIDFENSEGNLGIANAYFSHLAQKLPVSRMQRDLTDSTVIRNTGMPLAYSLIAYSSLMKGLNKIYVNEEKIAADLNDNWAIIAEAIQTILRRENYPNPYDALKKLTRNNNRITKEDLVDFIENIDVDDTVKRELLAISPSNYLGYSNDEL